MVIDLAFDDALGADAFLEQLTKIWQNAPVPVASPRVSILETLDSGVPSPPPTTIEP